MGDVTCPGWGYTFDDLCEGKKSVSRETFDRYHWIFRGGHPDSCQGDNVRSSELEKLAAKAKRLSQEVERLEDELEAAKRRLAKVQGECPHPAWKAGHCRVCLVPEAW